jgi:hypothetical protein
MSILRVTIKEELTINGVERNSEFVRTLTDVTESSSRMVEIGTSEVEILRFGSTVGAGRHVASDVKYLRITHIEPSTAGTTTIELRISSRADDKEYFVVLEEGASFLLSNVEIDAVSTDSTGSPAIGGTFSTSDIDYILAKGSAAGLDLNIVVAE